MATGLRLVAAGTGVAAAFGAWVDTPLGAAFGAAFGGGGRGMRIVREAGELEKLLDEAQTEDALLRIVRARTTNGKDN